MIKVLLIDAFSSLHVGNGALIDNTYKMCKRYLSNDVDILTIDVKTNEGRFENVKEDYFSKYGGGSVNKLKISFFIIFFYFFEFINIKFFRNKIIFPWPRGLKNIRNCIADSDVCVSLSGETINDHYYPHMVLRVLIYNLAIVSGKKFVFFPQSIGPIYRGWSKLLLRFFLGRSAVIMARDQKSLALSRKIWGDKNTLIIFCPDVAFSQESECLSLSCASSDKKVIGLTVSDMPREEVGFYGTYIENIVVSIREVFDSEKYMILIMPSNYSKKGASKDYKVGLEALDALKLEGYEVSILEDKIYHPEVFQGFQKSLELFISMRMHVGILAVSAGIPTVMINTQYKIREFMRLVGMNSLVVEMDDLSELSTSLKVVRDEN